MLNIILIILILIVAVGGLYLVFRPKKNITIEETEDKYSVSKLLEFTKVSFNTMLKVNLKELKISKDEYDKRLKNKANMRKALKTCAYGDVEAKAYVKDSIKDIFLNDYGINEENINLAIPFDNLSRLTNRDKFDIILHMYKKKYGKDGLKQLIKKYDLDQIRDDEYYIDENDLKTVFAKEKKALSFEDKLDILVQRIYSKYKGFGPIDEIRDMNIDGVSGGVSGVTPEMFETISMREGVKCSYETTWIFFQGKLINLRFLGFESQKELERVCKNIYKYNSPGQLSESNGYKVNEMKDGSRIVVARPPFCEEWVFFVRKFDSIKEVLIEELITDPGKEKPINLIWAIIKGCRVAAVTGDQGTGKTTLLMAMVKFISKILTLRIQEMASELHLRKLYPTRNIVSFRETPTISGQEGLDLQKKTDGSVNILGEVATASVASWMIQMGQVASLFTLFTHHAKTTADLITHNRNALLQEGGFTSEEAAEKQVVNVINFDIHLNKTASGHRYIERITEIRPVEEDYPEYSDEFELKDMVREFFKRMTNKKIYDAVDIIRWQDGKYEVVNTLSEKNIAEISSKLLDKDLEKFNRLLANGWEE